jgi:hypothetical protein
MPQLWLFDGEHEAGCSRAGRSGSFIDNMQLSVHRWFRYSAGFSAEWANLAIRECSSRHVLDPFAGSGTVVLEGERTGVEAIGLEAHPFVARIARAKLHWREDPKAVRQMGRKILALASKHIGHTDGYATLIKKCFPPEALSRLEGLKNAWQHVNDGSAIGELCWLALVSILRAVSPVGTAQWQYVLPRKTKSRASDPFEAYELRIALMAQDMAAWQQNASGPCGSILCADARECSGVPDGWADLVITSPPYANNYDYADATRLEMTFFGEINGWGDLQAAVRRHLVRSCTQHVAPIAGRIAETLRSPLLSPIAAEIVPICEKLGAVKDEHGGKKQYDAMIANYFLDLAGVWKALRRVTQPGGRACFVVGDSAPYGVYVPVDKWLGELAVAAGFRSFRFEKLRDRNIKWKNRKHRVPLHEGRLWVEG